MRNHIGVRLTERKKVLWKDNKQSFSLAHVCGYKGKVIPVIFLGKAPPKNENRVERNIVDTIEHEVIHIILWKEIDEECSRKFDNVCEGVRINYIDKKEDDKMLIEIRKYLKWKHEHEEKFKCESCDELMGISLRFIIEDADAKYIVCCSCAPELLNNSLTPDQFNNLLKNGHKRKEHLLHLDFYDYDGVALQPSICKRDFDNFLNGRWEKRAYDVE